MSNDEAERLISQQQDAHLVDNWVGVHLAIVDEPAFTIKKAVISETCGGSEKGCLMQLRKAHISKFGVGNCGFCVKKALNTLQILHTARTKKNLTSQVSTTNKKDIERNKLMSQLEPLGVNDPSSSLPQQQQQQTNVNAADLGNNNENKEFPTQQEQQRQQRPNRQAVNPSAASLSPLDLIQENERLKQELELYRLKDEEKSGAIDTLTARIEKMEREDRKEKISRIITADVIKDDKIRLEKINRFTASNIPITEIEELYKPVRMILKKASTTNRNNANFGRVPYITGSNNNTTVRSSGSSNDDDIFGLADYDSENGISPLAKQLAVLEGGL